MPSSTGDVKRWYVVQTQPRKERLAERHLRNQDFETFCPCGRRMRRIGGRMRTMLEPFFPNYLFVALDLERQRWRSVNGTIGVVRLVSFGAGGLPASMPEGLIERFKLLSAADGELRYDEQLACGDRVRIVGGPFDALCGTLEATSAGERVRVLLKILSRDTRVEIDRRHLVAG